MKDDRVYDIEQTIDDVTTSMLLRAKARQEDAWTKLVNAFCPLVYLWCRRHLCQAVDVENVGQEVFLSVSLRLPEFKGDMAAFRAWLWTITMNKIRDHYRARNKQPLAVGGSDAQQGLLQVPAPDDDSALTASHGDLKESTILCLQIVDSLRDGFEKSTWEAFKQVVVNGRPPVDVAADLGMSVNAVYIAKSRVLSRIRGEFAQHGVG